MVGLLGCGGDCGEQPSAARARWRVPVAKWQFDTYGDVGEERGYVTPSAGKA
jgi:hypothetical protein